MAKAKKKAAKKKPRAKKKGYSAGEWKGIPSLKCDFCPHAVLNKEDAGEASMAAHVEGRHSADNRKTEGTGDDEVGGGTHSS